MGTPYHIIVDEKTLETGILTLQDRDTTAMVVSVTCASCDRELENQDLYLIIPCRRIWLVVMCYTLYRGCCQLPGSIFIHPLSPDKHTLRQTDTHTHTQLYSFYDQSLRFSGIKQY